MASGPAIEGPSTDRIARARCLVPILGHVAIRLASLSPAVRAIEEVSGRAAERGADWREETLEALGDPAGICAAVEETITCARSIARFAVELAELCGAEGQWLAVLALAPKVVEKFADDFARLGAHLEGLGDAFSAGAQGVATQPGADSPDRILGAPIVAAAQALALRSLFSAVAGDLKSDAEGAFSGKLAAPELEAAHVLRRHLLPRALAPESGEPVGREELFGHLSALCPRPAAALARELEAAEQYCRVLDGTAPSHARGDEPRPPCGGRDALVSEAQASGGSALHRWIRTQVAEPSACVSARPPGGGKPQGRPSFVKLSEIPHEFLCPIAQDVMRDAVSTCDGHTYERRNIEAWLGEKSTSPITGLPLANKTLIPNHNLRKLILDSGVLSRLEPDSKPESGASSSRFREVGFEIEVPRDAGTLAEALGLGVARVAAQSMSSGRAQRLPTGSARPALASRAPAFGIRLSAGDHVVQQTLLLEQEVEVEIVGCGPAVTSVRLLHDACVELRGTVRLANFALCRDAPSAGPPTVDACALESPPARSMGSSGKSPTLIEISQGSCRIEQCDLYNPMGSAIRISGAHTSPVIARNTIHGCRDTGVVFKDGADGTLSGNRLFGNSSVAIEIHSRADPLVEDNDIFDGRQGGVFVYNRGKGHLRRNKIFRNALEGVEIKQDGRPLVEDNDIYDNLECGIFIHEGGEGRVIGNRIHSNSYAGIEIKDSSSPEVRGNDIYGGRTSGMYIHSGGQGVVEGNQIHQNWLHGVYVRSKGFPHLMKNNIFKNDECGIFVTESSHPCIEHNEVHSNGLAGIEVKEDSNPTIKLNRIHDGNTGGIFVLARGRGRICENKLYNNKLEGIEIKDGGDPQVIDNEIYENFECGVFAHDGALGRIEDNRIFSNAYAGIEIKDMSSPVVKNNRIYRGQTSGIYVHSGGQGKLTDNEVFENGLHGVMILSGGNPWMSRNKVHDNTECGVVAHVAYALDASSNQIYGNRIKNVQTVKS